MIGKYEITDVKARQIYDSRGNPTVEVDVITGKGFGRASAPSGASKGTKEAIELRDGGKRWGGKGVKKALKSVVEIEKELKGHDCRDQDGIDRSMINLDNTPNKKRLGANATSAVSMAICKAAASSKEGEVYDHVGIITGNREITGDRAYSLPVPFFNVLNGGQHAANYIDIQEFMIAPIGANSFAEAMMMGSEIYFSLKGILQRKYGKSAVNVGDEGGFAPPLKKTDEALKAITLAIKKSGYQKEVGIALDCAASSFYKGKKYTLDGKKLSSEQLVDYYEKLVKKYNIISIEDAFAEDDWKGFSLLTSRIGEDIQIVGDDIFVTNNELVKRGIRERACNSVLLKINQVGTILETLDAMHLARNSNYTVMVSHRSGETSDSFIADFAVGINAKQIKTGAPCRGERLAKYNQLLRLEEFDIPYAGTAWRS